MSRAANPSAAQCQTYQEESDDPNMVFFFDSTRCEKEPDQSTLTVLKSDSVEPQASVAMVTLRNVRLH